jgi:(2Fe-2S) ferredoxin
MSRYRRHIFVCINQRPAGHPKGCCFDKGSEKIRDALKAELEKRGLGTIVRANNSGCLDACEHGITMVIYPEAIWYGRVTPDDIPEIIDRTIIRGEVIQRLLIPDSRYRPDILQFPPLNYPGITELE